MPSLFSIIIPTSNRPYFLPRAIDSALEGMDRGSIEVIVVPNGPDESWRRSLLPYQNNPCVRVIRIMDANANAARNAGLSAAQGEFVRFLDDDDYLLPEGAIKQYELITSSGLDIVSGGIQVIDAKGRLLENRRQPDTDDLCCAVLGPSRLCHPFAHLYRRSKLLNFIWNPDTPAGQDFEWLVHLASSHELYWQKVDDMVGAWQHHWNMRVSSSVKYNDIRKLCVIWLLHAYERLQAEGRLDEERKTAAVQGFLGFVHQAFYFDPKYWTKIFKITRKIDATVRPFQRVYGYPVVRNIDFLFLQWNMLPARLGLWYCRQLLKRWRIQYFYAY